MDTNHETRAAISWGADRLRAPERLALMELPRVADLSTEGLSVRELLDIGTGTGVFAEAFAAKGIAVTGIDVNAQLLELARAHAPSGRFLEAPAEKLPFPDRSFDLVFFGLVLHETDDPAAALEEARRVARHRVAVLEWSYREEPQGPPLAHRMSEETIEDLALEAGFSGLEYINLRQLAFLSARHPRKLMSPRRLTASQPSALP